ncbi:MAG: ATP-binding protein, partial [Rhodoglobus sp.]
MTQDCCPMMAMVFDVVRRARTVAVRGRLNVDFVHVFMRALREVEKEGYESAELDFSGCDSAYPDGSTPLAAIVDAARTRGLRFELRLPNDHRIANLFVRTNLAHYVQPETFPLHTSYVPKHVPIRRFETLEDQVAVVSELMEVLLKTIALPRDVFQGLEWSINEIMDNVLNHAQAPRGGFVQATTTEDRVSFTVADAGIGILKSLREGYPALVSDGEAIGEAIKAGVTRNPEAGQGNGLAGSLNIATQTGGSLTIMSGRGMLLVHHDDEGVKSVRRVLAEDQA